MDFKISSLNTLLLIFRMYVMISSLRISEISLFIYIQLIIVSILFAQKPELVIQNGHSNAFIRSVKFSLDDKYIISVASHSAAVLWDVMTGKGIKTFWDISDLIEFSPDGKFLVAADKNGIVRFIDITSGKDKKVYLDQAGEIRALSLSPDCRMIAAITSDTTIDIWDTKTGDKIKTFLIKYYWSEHIPNFYYDPFEYGLLNESEVRRALLRVKRSMKDVIAKKMYGYNGLHKLTFSSDGKFIVTTSTDGTIRLLVIKTDKEVVKLINFTDYSQSTSDYLICISNDNRYVASTHNDTLKIWDMKTKNVIRKFKFKKAINTYKQDENTIITFSPDNKYIFSSNDMDSIKIWDIPTGQNLMNLKDQGYSINFSHSGKYIAIGKFETIGLYDVNTGYEIRKFNFNQFLGIKSVCYSPNGRTVAIMYNKPAVWIWDLGIGRPKHFILIEDLIRVQPEGSSVAYSPDGKLIAIGNSNVYRTKPKSFFESINSFGFQLGIRSLGNPYLDESPIEDSSKYSLKLLDINSGKEIAKFLPYNGRVNSIKFNPKNSLITTLTCENIYERLDCYNGPIPPYTDTHIDFCKTSKLIDN